jgi:hypothetical protein
MWDKVSVKEVNKCQISMTVIYKLLFIWLIPNCQKTTIHLNYLQWVQPLINQLMSPIFNRSLSSPEFS